MWPNKENTVTTAILFQLSDNSLPHKKVLDDLQPSAAVVWWSLDRRMNLFMPPLKQTDWFRLLNQPVSLNWVFHHRASQTPARTMDCEWVALEWGWIRCLIHLCLFPLQHQWWPTCSWRPCCPIMTFSFSTWETLMSSRLDASHRLSTFHVSDYLPVSTESITKCMTDDFLHSFVLFLIYIFQNHSVITSLNSIFPINRILSLPFIQFFH